MEQVRRRSSAGIILIALGVLFLVANLANAQGWGWSLGLGLALLAAFFWSDWYGLAVAGCLLAAVGVFGLLERNHWLLFDRSVTFLVALGLGFVAIYPLSRRWRLWWPLMPGVILLWIAVIPAVVTRLGWLSLEQWASLTHWWPVLLVVLGVWIVLRPILPPRTERAARVAVVMLVVVICLFLATGLAVSAASTMEPVQAAPHLGVPRYYWRW